MIIGTKISKSYSKGVVIEDISFKLGNSKKIGIVGVNGSGKTTLLKIIAGLEEPGSGDIQMNQEIIGYIPQEFNFPKNTKIGEYLTTFLENSWESYRIDELINRLSFHNYNPDQKISTLSDGQKMKVKMASIFLGYPTILLIDEPTNHLDIEGIKWFENYIKNIDITVAFISHDRQFLNNVVNEIWEIEKQQMLRFVGNYDNYQLEKIQHIKKQGREYKLFLKKKSQFRAIVRKC